MNLSNVVAAAVSLLVSALLVIVIRPSPCPDAATIERLRAKVESAPQATLLEGKYLVIEDSGGHWVYEKTPDGWAVKIRGLGPEGLAAIWELQAKFNPYSIDSGSGMLINFPVYQYSTETGQFQVVHRFFRYHEDKLVEVQLVPAKPQ